MNPHTSKATASAIAVALFFATALLTHTIVSSLSYREATKPAAREVEYVLPNTKDLVNNQPNPFKF
jgi:hypothetical protein